MYDRLFKFEIESFRTLRLSSLSLLSFFWHFLFRIITVYEFYVGVQSPELFLTDRSDSSSAQTAKLPNLIPMVFASSAINFEIHYSLYKIN